MMSSKRKKQKSENELAPSQKGKDGGENTPPVLLINSSKEPHRGRADLFAGSETP